MYNVRRTGRNTPTQDLVSVDAVRKAKKEGYTNITCEVAPHHLIFDESMIWYKKDKPRMWILHFFAGSCDQIFVFYQLKYYLIIYKLLIIKENKNFKYFNDLIKHLFFVLNY